MNIEVDVELISITETRPKYKFHDPTNVKIYTA